MTWRERLGYAPKAVVIKTFDATTQLVIEAENRDDPREFMKSHLLALRFPRLNDTFHTDSACCKVTSVRGHTCFQVYAGFESAAVYAWRCAIEVRFGHTLVI
jgi:hypothetical protein